ncbi:GntR family transcriptional regulator [Arthrobacter sp. B2a2-09]|uniref:GntR family transcriptional regulator n=1 Tax=Arthrobacter sp. B2a2-09 TaxID=2952822 RepID=UPI0022CD7F77|nr:GntR family transcriptional regulator [Arthrobacter sp. B2a2-09]MCZ9881788.1 GntR family transcriptional regulator [Arthrobacter sp. B2a2-09]
MTPNLLPVDANSPVPLYHQVAERIKAAVQSNVLQEGKVIGPETHLARNFHVSLPTIRRALEILASEGIVVRKHGHGTFVAGALRSSPLGVTRHIEPGESQSKCTVLSIGEASLDPIFRERLRLTDGDRLWCVIRLEEIHDVPTAILEDYLFSEPTPQDHARFNEADADALLVHSQCKVRTVQHEIKALAAHDGLAQKLKVGPGTPLIVLERTVFDEGGKPVEFGKYSHLASHYKFGIIS